MTLIELLVAAGIIATLIAIALVALQGAREGAHIYQCKNNLRQIGIAIQSYQSSNNDYLPKAYKGYSFYCGLLPYLEMPALYHCMNFDVAASRSQGQNATAINTRLNLLSCPGDGMFGSTGATNYAGSLGTASPDGTHRKKFDNGIFVPIGSKPVRGSSIVDGSSNTVAVAEWLLDPADYRASRKGRTVFATSVSQDSSGWYDNFVDFCQGDGVRTATARSGKGKDWTNGNLFYTYYNHVLNVNGNSCVNNGRLPYSIITPASAHPGGISVLFSDGHTGFIRESISLSVWRALGTRNGGEVLSQDGF